MGPGKEKPDRPEETPPAAESEQLAASASATGGPPPPPPAGNPDDPPCPPAAATTLLSEADVCSDGVDEPYVWQRRWFQIMLVSVVVFVVLAYVVPGAVGALYAVRSVLVPVLVGLGLAYIVNPALRFAGREAGIGRLAGTISIMLIALVVIATLMVTAVPLMYEQGKSLTLTVQDKYPTYIEKVLDQLDQQFPVLEPEGAGEDADDAGTPGEGEGEGKGEEEGESEGSGVERSRGTASDDVAPRSADSPSAPAVAEGGSEPDAGSAADDSARGRDDAVELLDAAADAARADGDLDTAEKLDAVVEDPDATPLVQNVLKQQRTRRLLGMAVEKLRSLEGDRLATFARQSFNVGVGLVGTAIGFTSYLALAAIIITFCFFFFSWKFDAILAWFEPFIPARSRDHTLAMLRKMDMAVSSFVRGRLIQSVVMMTVLAVGWWLVDVPYWFLLGVLTGLLNVVPFLPAAGGLLAVVLTVMTALANGGDFTWGLLLWPALVFVIAQTLDGYLVEPVVQGKATNLDPLSVMLVVLVGGSLAGLLGMLLAIPLAACVKILMQELVLPRVRSIAAEN